jgi:hypothetical protein
MKKIIILTMLTVAATGAFAQQAQKKLPAKASLVLTDKEVSELYTKIDSLSKIALQSSLPSNFIQAFNARVIKALEPLSIQINSQLVADTVKQPKRRK